MLMMISCEASQVVRGMARLGAGCCVKCIDNVGYTVGWASTYPGSLHERRTRDYQGNFLGTKRRGRVHLQQAAFLQVGVSRPKQSLCNDAANDVIGRKSNTKYNLIQTEYDSRGILLRILVRDSRLDLPDRAVLNDKGRGRGTKHKGIMGHTILMCMHQRPDAAVG